MSTMQTLDEVLGRIAQGNRHYTYNRNQWRYLLESYLGGQDYQRGQHLTRYQLETDAEYGSRLKATPLQNHCKSVIDVYNSFLFRNEPERDLGSLVNSPELADFLEDCDMEGRSLNAFMKDVSTWGSVFGHCWIIMTKPNVGANTRADELSVGVRPYVNLLSPLMVLDWSWERQANGGYELKRLKYIEDINGTVQTIREWTADTITTHIVDYETRVVTGEGTEVNELGMIPAVVAYNNRSLVRGLGVSDIADIADLQKFIYNNLSEVEQTIRMDSHPSLVKTPETQASTGAGSIISMPENLDPGLKPYLLEFNGASVASIYESINQAVESIDALSNTSSVRAQTSKVMSGIALQTEFQLLNAKLAEKADNLQLAEEQLWQLYAAYQNIMWDGEIEYPDTFDIQDEADEFTKLQVAKTAATGPEALRMIDIRLIELLSEYDDAGEIVAPDVQLPPVAAPVTDVMSADYAAPTAPTDTAPAPDACPTATQDVAVNIKNRQTAIDRSNYGPMNPGLPNRTFWMAKATMFKTTADEARTALCGNCAAFDQRQVTLDCIDAGLAAGGSGAASGWDTIAAADIGYCEVWDFKCAAARTCDAWITGGPLTDSSTQTGTGALH